MSCVSQILVFFLLYISIQCFMSTCISSVAPFSNSNAIISLPSLSPELEEISGKLYRKLFAYDDGLWMLARFPISKSGFNLTDNCPSGWLPPTVEDLNSLLKFAANKALFTASQFFNLQTHEIFASNTKKNPQNTNINDTEAYVFYGIKLQANGSGYLGEFSSLSDNENAKTFCIHSSKSINNSYVSPATLNLIKPKGNLMRGLKYTLSVNNTNMVEFEWTIGNQTINSRELNFIPMKTGFYDISVKGKFFDGTIFATCTSIRIIEYFSSERNIKFANNVKFNNLTINRIMGSHMSAGSAPIAPKVDGGAYIIYSTRPDNKLYVKLVSNEGMELDDFDLGKTGFPFDILAVNCGFMALIEEFPNSNKLLLIEMNTCSKTKPFEATLLNDEVGEEKNDERQGNKKSQEIVFHTDLSSTAIFGIEAIYNSKTGKIMLAQNKTATLFSHYNSFEGFNDDTSDNSVILNFKESNEKFNFVWGTSHRLVNSFLHNGSFIYGASLSDSHPLNIRYLNDGRLVWTSVDTNFTLNYFYFNKSSEIGTNLEYVKSLPFYKEKDDFYLIHQNDLNFYQTKPSDASEENLLLEPVDEKDDKIDRLNKTETEKHIDTNVSDGEQLGWMGILTVILMTLAHYLIKKI